MDDRGLLLINWFFLMWIVRLLFSATLLSRFEDEQAAVIHLLPTPRRRRRVGFGVGVGDMPLAPRTRMDTRLMDARQCK